MPLGHIREPTESEVRFFKSQRGSITPAYAAEDGAVVFNPFINLSPQQRRSLLINERARLMMRHGLISTPDAPITPSQKRAFSGYSNDPRDVIATIMARIAAGDPSVPDATDQQMFYAKQLKDLVTNQFPEDSL